MLVIGLMSGTSLDGVDAALIDINEEKEGISIKLINYILLQYSETFRKKIMNNLSDETAKLSEICSLNFELGYKFKEAIDKVLENTEYNYSDISYAMSHGQTIWHSPKKSLNTRGVEIIPSTLQIGDASVISTLTNIKVISNFRSSDVVAGGEGAPLVPMSEYILFRKENKNVVLQNIGGIGNLTYLKKGCKISDVIAFDTGPGNAIIDYFVSKYYKMNYDAGGKIALSGKIINEVIDALMQDDYIYKCPPKSTGREKYSKESLEKLAEKLNFEKYKKEDIITTITEYTVQTIIYSYDNYIKDIDEIIIGGGGSHNNYIINRLKDYYKNIKCYTQDEIGYSSDAKEAMAFALLGYLSLKGECGNVPSATGAKYSVVLGNMTLVKRG